MIIYDSKKLKPLIKEVKQIFANSDVDVGKTVIIHGERFLETDLLIVSYLERKEEIYLFNANPGKDILKLQGYAAEWNNDESEQFVVGVNGKVKIDIGKTVEFGVKGFNDKCVNIFAKSAVGYITRRVENTTKSYIDKSMLNTLGWMIQKKIYHN